MKNGDDPLFILAPILKNKKFYHNSTLNLRRWIIREYRKPLTSNNWDTEIITNKQAFQVEAPDKQAFQVEAPDKQAFQVEAPVDNDCI